MSRRGFALVEVVVATVIAGGVALMVHRGVHTLLEAGDRAAAVREEAAHAAAVRRQLVAWLNAATVEGSLESWDFEGTGGVSDGGDPDAALSFITLAPGPFEPGRARLMLRIAREVGTGTSALVATRDTAGADAAPEVLVPGARGLAVRYLHTVDGERTWTDTWRSSAQLPEAIELRILGDSLPPVLRLPVFVVPRSGA
ncbi:MAG TPA: prepilin-type N-terminal cleavage/methylation domain-containing protein [Longimicrobiaceae bacterium]|nr:prepilin-type N-terminal cleavage/methylation domain-containing protein [Longimicrobiaceae bacterium]